MTKNFFFCRSRISKDTMKNVQNQCDLSNEAILDVAASLREDGVEIEPGLKKEIRESGKLLSDYFEVQDMEMEVKVEDEIVEKPKPVIVCKDVDEFIEFVKIERKIKNPVTLKFGADGGGNY